jgi:hypothetical protein
MSLPRSLERRRTNARSKLAQRRIERVVQDGGPIVAGPWSGPPVFELLYWIPLLNWLTGVAGIPPERVSAVSRGGVDRWYADVAGTYRDVEDAESLPAGSAELAPADMASLFAPYWRFGSPAPLRRHAVHRQLPAETATPPVRKPYVLLDGSFGESFRDEPAAREFLARAAGELGERANLALLDPPDAVGLAGEDVTELCRTPGGLTQIVRGAEAVVAPFGDAAVIGPMVGTPTLVFYSHGGVAVPHLHLLLRVARRLAGDDTPLLRARHIDSVETALAPRDE